MPTFTCIERRPGAMNGMASVGILIKEGWKSQYYYKIYTKQKKTACKPTNGKKGTPVKILEFCRQQAYRMIK
jgi:hypothetical protein